MSHSDLQPLKIEDLSAEELQSQKAQQAIDDLLASTARNEALKRQLETITSSESLVKIAASQGYQLTVAEIETLLQRNQKQVQFDSEEFDDDELSEQELEVVVGGGFIANNSTFNKCLGSGIYMGNIVPLDRLLKNGKMNVTGP